MLATLDQRRRMPNTLLTEIEGAIAAIKRQARVASPSVVIEVQHQIVDALLEMGLHAAIDAKCGLVLALDESQSDALRELEASRTRVIATEGANRERAA